MALFHLTPRIWTWNLLPESWRWWKNVFWLDQNQNDNFDYPESRRSDYATNHDNYTAGHQVSMFLLASKPIVALLLLKRPSAEDKTVKNRFPLTSNMLKQGNVMSLWW